MVIFKKILKELTFSHRCWELAGHRRRRPGPPLCAHSAPRQEGPGDRDGRDQTMSCIHGGRGQSRAGAFRPRAPPRPRAEPSSPSAGPAAALPGPGARGRRRGSGCPCGAGVAPGGRDAQPAAPPTRAVPLRRTSSRAAPPRGAATSGLPSWQKPRPFGQLPVRSRDARLAAADGRRAATPSVLWWGQDLLVRGLLAGHARLSDAQARNGEAGTRVTDAQSAGACRERAPASGPPHPLRVPGEGGAARS